MNVTVALAAYHGEAYVRTQIESILPQLGKGDELIVSDDAPGGKTEQIVLQFVQRDARVQYIKGPGRGVCANFAHILAHGTGDVFFLCDQDDIWLPQKRELVLREFHQGASLVMHDAIVTDEALQMLHPSFFAWNQQGRGFVRNFLHNSYIGCCLAFTRELRDFALPFPRFLPMHDWWLGLLAEARPDCAIHIIQQPLLYYRRHEHAVTASRASVLRGLRWRALLLPSLAMRLYLPRHQKNAIL